MTDYQAELLTIIVSGTSRRNVLGAIASKRTIATSRSDDNRDESRNRDNEKNARFTATNEPEEHATYAQRYRYAATRRKTVSA